MSQIIYYLIIFFSLMGFEFLYFKIARKFNIIDKPNQRSSHSNITLRGGGIIFPISCFIYFAWFRYFPIFMLGLFFISLVSFVDDIKALGNIFRSTVHFCSVGLLLYQLDVPLLFMWYPVFFILIVGTINAYNFMDGINGITGLYSLLLFGTFLYIEIQIIHFVDIKFITLNFLATLVFLFYNFRKKAICFAGDVGSVSIAFIACFILLQAAIAMHSYIPVLFLGLYGIDAVTTIIFRLVRKENIFIAHRTHLYQVLANEYGKDHRVISIGYCLVQLTINCLAIYLHFYLKLPDWAVTLFLLFFPAILYLYVRIRLQTWKILTEKAEKLHI